MKELKMSLMAGGGVLLLLVILVLVFWYRESEMQTEQENECKAKIAMVTDSVDNYWRKKIDAAPVEKVGEIPVPVYVPPIKTTVPAKTAPPTKDDSILIEQYKRGDSLEALVYSYQGVRSVDTTIGRTHLNAWYYPNFSRFAFDIFTTPDTVPVPVYQKTVAITDTIAPDETQWYWNAGSINADFVWSGELQAGFSYSLWAWSAGGRDPKQIILRLPEFGVNTEFKNKSSVSVGVRLNVGHWLPLFNDLYITPKYGYEFKTKEWQPMVGLGTGL